MSRLFPLAGLLRIRKMEEDRSRQRLAQANSNLAETLEEVGGLHAYLATERGRRGVNASLAAVAASRAATAGMLAILDREVEERQAAVDEARDAYTADRMRSRALEKLADNHEAQVAAEEQRAEQVMLDEAAAAGWARGGQSR